MNRTMALAFLSEKGFKTRNKGTAIVADMLCHMSDLGYLETTRDICEHVARQHDTTPESVERSARYVISAVYPDSTVKTFLMDCMTELVAFEKAYYAKNQKKDATNEIDFTNYVITAQNDIFNALLQQKFAVTEKFDIFVEYVKPVDETGDGFSVYEFGLEDIYGKKAIFYRQSTRKHNDIAKINERKAYVYELYLMVRKIYKAMDISETYVNILINTPLNYFWGKEECPEQFAL